ncbi:MAG: hypothetical protein A2Y25_01620 [Candidatus Melainabacteria bacterium GWF2_37_15]|nr:MAG: hypothetical protein A2Y25_01620 [Candidatus Melainabacteria bacterium GWF2_37_15]
MGNTTIQLNHDTAANWTTNNPTLAAGEIGLETDTKRIKVGDGSTTWNSLAYYGVGSSFKYGLYTLSANQTSNVAANNHVEFNTKIDGSLNTPSTGSGQENGRITLPTGTYKVTATLFVSGSSGGGITYDLYNVTSSSTINSPLYGNQKTTTYTGNYSNLQPLINVFTVSTETQIELRITGNTNITTICAGSSLLIEEYGGY